MINQIPLAYANRGRIEQWIAALRSGHYKQTKHVLSSMSRKGTLRFCCLGVACNLYDPEGWIPFDLDETIGDEDFVTRWYHSSEDDVDTLPPNEWYEWMFGERDGGLDPCGSVVDTLAALNDKGASFQDIADCLEDLLSDEKMDLRDFVYKWDIPGKD